MCTVYGAALYWNVMNVSDKSGHWNMGLKCTFYSHLLLFPVTTKKMATGNDKYRTSGSEEGLESLKLVLVHHCITAQIKVVCYGVAVVLNCEATLCQLCMTHVHAQS